MCKNINDFLLTVEPLSVNHIPAITAMLEHDSLDGFKWINEGYSNVEDFIKNVLFRDHVHNGFYWALRFGNSIVGFAGFRWIESEGKYFTKSYVTPLARGKGIASNITRCLVLLAVNLEIELFSRVDTDNDRSYSRLDKLVGNATPGTAAGKRYFSLDVVPNSELREYSPVIFALSEKMQLDLSAFSYFK